MTFLKLTRLLHVEVKLIGQLVQRMMIDVAIELLSSTAPQAGTLLHAARGEIVL
jgi:hypothetical protein